MIKVCITQYGTKTWRLAETADRLGKLHRTHGPAVVYPDGSYAWYNQGLRHRTDGPAIELADGTVEYWGNNQLVTEYELMFLKH